MSGLPRNLYTASAVRALDQAAIEQYRIPGFTLMERAGQATFNALRRRWPTAKRVAMLCGGGNNGGDGYIVARLAQEAGLEVDCVSLTDPDQLRGNARRAYESLAATGLALQPYSAGCLEQADVVVDALLGTGLDREVTGAYRTAIEALNASRAAVVAVDIPSGLHADTGRVLGVAVRAIMTVTFIGLKQGMFTAEGPRHCGYIRFDDLQVPAAVAQAAVATAERILDDEVRAVLPPRSPTAHKGEHGHCLLLGGDYGMLGAVRMAGEAAARAGAGLVSIVTRAEHAALISAVCPEIMAYGASEPRDAALLFRRASVVAVGPGLGQSAWSQGMLEAALASGLPLVVDADGLNLLAANPCRHEHWILTPHPGEAGRLLGATASDIQADRFNAVGELQSRYGGVCVLKGAGTLIAGANGPIAVCGTGNPGMAVGGMGDVLTGVIAALRGQGLSAEIAARIGAYVHGAAGDAAAAGGERGLLPSDLLATLRAVVNPAGD